MAGREALTRQQLHHRWLASQLSLNQPRAMRRKPKHVYVLRKLTLGDKKTANGICAHLVEEPLEGY